MSFFPPFSKALNGPELAVQLLSTRQTLPRAIVQPDALRAHTCNFGADSFLPLCSQNRLKKENLSSLFASKKRRQRWWWWWLGLWWQQDLLLPPLFLLTKFSLSSFSQGRNKVLRHSDENISPPPPLSPLSKILGNLPQCLNSAMNILGWCDILLSYKKEKKRPTPSKDNCYRAGCQPWRKEQSGCVH